MKRPSFQFYPGDWLNDAALRMVSIGARGLWIEMMCLMHQGSEYGYLKVNGKVILSSNLARMSGGTLSEVEGYLAELESAGVFSRDEQGCIFSRRMIRDEKIREARAAGGIKGGNPALLKGKEGSKKVDGKVNLPANLPPTPSSSSSSSSSSTTKDNMSGEPDVACEIIDYLNERAGRNFGHVKANLDLVRARLKEGATVEVIKAVIDEKVRKWKNDPKWSEYLRPETLFGARKFAQYSGQLGAGDEFEEDNRPKLVL